MNYENSVISKIIPYTAGEQPQDKKYVKLNTNENPYPPSPKVKNFLSGYDISDLKLYPDPDCTVLKAEIAKVYDLESENIFVGNGSDEILAMIFGTFFERGKEVAFADITYSFYKVYAELFGIKKRLIPLKDDFSIDPKEYFGLKTNGIVIANPNAPTGRTLSKSEIESIIVNNRDKLVAVDEAYVDFCCESCVELVEKYDNVLIVKTFSKSYSLAGIRCGFVIADNNLIAGLDKFKNSFNSYTTDRICQRVCAVAVADEAYHKITTDKIVETRARMTRLLEELDFNVIPSGANFIFASHNRINAEDIYLELKTRGVLVRYFKQPRIDNYLRITVGNDDETDILVKELKRILG